MLEGKIVPPAFRSAVWFHTQEKQISDWTFWGLERVGFLCLNKNKYKKTWQKCHSTELYCELLGDCLNWFWF